MIWEVSNMDEQEFKEVKMLIDQVINSVKLAIKETKDIPNYIARIKELTVNATNEQLKYIEDRDEELIPLVEQLEKTFQEASNMSDKWCYSFDGGRFDSALFGTKEDAIKEALREIESDCIKQEVIWVGKHKDAKVPDIDAIQVIENMQYEAICDLEDGIGDDFLEDTPREQIKELEEKLNKVWLDWIEKYNHKPTWFEVDDVEEVILK